MSELVCYIERAERGSLPLRLRLLSTRVEEVWTFPEVLADDRAALQRGLGEAADWLAAQLKAHSRAGLGALVLDPDGSRCGWVSSLSPDPDAIGAMLQQAAEPISEEDAAHTVGSTPQLALCPDVKVAGGTTFQPLGTQDQQATPQQRQRLGVVAVPDATVRLLLDELDARGVEIARIVTTWHALAEAFEAGGATNADSLVAASQHTTAQVMVDPGSGRLVWSWSRSGQPIAAGSFRLPHPMPSPDAHAQAAISLGHAELARLASEWIGWATQLGASPTRVRLVLPEQAWDDSMSLGECVAKVWPGATTDIAFDDDPVAMVLSRFADGLGDPRVTDTTRGTLEVLQARPGTQHRSMYRWAAVAIALAAGAMGVAAFQVYASAKAARTQAEEVRTAWRATAGELLPLVNDSFAAGPGWDARAVADIQEELDRRRRKVAPVRATPQKPIMQELETLSFVLGNPDYKLEKIELSETAVTITVVVPNTAAYEELVESIERIAGSSVREWDKTPRPVPDGIRVNLLGLWGDPTQSTTAGGA
ncbi:hypothetical protein MNBD_PLANCTO03-532 [hydrothermal vent metagenome]|uniref:Uncharacterized protein n=1 Tax=hydrothermal vent metagenome TaxID=652676 RepID=A0A3B1E701_9ZZZZ